MQSRTIIKNNSIAVNNSVNQLLMSNCTRKGIAKSTKVTIDYYSWFCKKQRNRNKTELAYIELKAKENIIKIITLEKKETPLKQRPQAAK